MGWLKLLRTPNFDFIRNNYAPYRIVIKTKIRGLSKFEERKNFKNYKLKKGILEPKSFKIWEIEEF